jgi:hypothetical protein
MKGPEILFTYLKVPLHKMTFSARPIREWVIAHCQDPTLNLFAGQTLLEGVDETRNDIRLEMPGDYHVDALQFVVTCAGRLFRTVILDPPYSYRKSMELYGSAISSPFNAIKDQLPHIMTPDGKVITFGYHSVSMGRQRGFVQQEILLMSHGGAIHDTIAVVERRIGTLDKRGQHEPL